MSETEKTENLILDLSFKFALDIIDYCEQLEVRKKFVIANQLLKSGTSIGANIREAQNPHSKSDFIAKMIISMKEADETEYWLLLCKNKSTYPDPSDLLNHIDQIKKIIGKIISSSKKSLNK